MKKLSHFLLITVFSSWMACNQAEKNESEDHHMEHASEEVHHEGHDHESSDALMLDKGKKWMVDDPTRMHVSNMEKAIQDPAIEKADMQFYQSLAGFLKENIGKLTADCSMTGQSHDELHKWLYPFIESTKEFSEAKNTEQASASLTKLKQSLAKFHEFFE